MGVTTVAIGRSHPTRRLSHYTSCPVCPDTTIQRRSVAIRAPYTGHHGIPTIKKYREEQKTRQADAREHDHHVADNAGNENGQTSGGAEEISEDSHGKEDKDGDDGEPAIRHLPGGC